MAKNILKLDLRVGNTENGERGIEVALEEIGKGAFLGELSINGISFHVEALEAEEDIPNNAESTVTIVNDVYENRLDSYIERNEGSLPQLTLGHTIPDWKSKKYFVTIEPFAQ